MGVIDQKHRYQPVQGLGEEVEQPGVEGVRARER